MMNEVAIDEDGLGCLSPNFVVRSPVSRYTAHARGLQFPATQPQAEIVLAFKC